MKNLLILTILLIPLTADAHRSGCHRWHSCVSNNGSYTCGDLGHCSQCPDNQYCQGGNPRKVSVESLKPQPMAKGQANRKRLPEALV